MKLSVSLEAANWYKTEMGLTNGDYLRFFVRIYGQSPIHPNYSLGIAKERPRKVGVSTEQAGITFYFEDEDLWFIEDHNLHIGLERDEIEMTYTKA